MKGTGIWIPPPGYRKTSPFGWRTWLGLAIAGALALVLLPLRAHYPLVPPDGAPRREVVGAYHVHSTRSDGRLSPEQIALAASDAGLDFVVLTDHNLAALPKPVYAHGVLLVPGEELSTHAGHLVALGTSRALTAEERGSDPVGHVDALGGYAVLAHPVQTRVPWTDWEAAKRARGFELYSGDTFLRDAIHRPFTRLIPALAAWPLRPVHAILQLTEAPPKATEHLLALAAVGKVASLCAADAHGLPRPAGREYEAEFRTFAMHLPTLDRPLPADPEVAARAVLEALGSGEAYCAFSALAPGNGFALGGIGAERTAKVGDRISLVLPQPAPAALEVRVAGGGEVVDGGRAVKLTQKGAVEIEVWAKAPGALFGTTWRPWLVASPVRVVGSESGANGGPSVEASPSARGASSTHGAGRTEPGASAKAPGPHRTATGSSGVAPASWAAPGASGSAPGAIIGATGTPGSATILPARPDPTAAAGPSSAPLLPRRRRRAHRRDAGVTVSPILPDEVTTPAPAAPGDSAPAQASTTAP